MTDVLHILNEIATKCPLDWLVASGLLSPLLLAVKKWRITRNVESLFSKEWFMYGTVIVSALSVAVGDYVLHTPTHDPSVIAVQAAMVAFMSQPVYFFAVKPLFRMIQVQIDKAVQLNMDIKSAAVPASTLEVRPPSQ